MQTCLQFGGLGRILAQFQGCVSSTYLLALSARAIVSRMALL